MFTLEAIVLHICCFIAIVGLYIYGICHKPVKIRLQSNVCKRLKKISVGVFVLYLLTLSSPFYFQQVYYHRIANGKLLQPMEAFVYRNSEYVLILLIPAVFLGISNISIYEDKNRNGEPR